MRANSVTRQHMTRAIFSSLTSIIVQYIVVQSNVIDRELSPAKVEELFLF